MRRLLMLFCVLFALTEACTPAASTPTGRNAPTLPAPSQFVEADQPVTLNNISGIKYLGRLDQPDTLSSIISYALSPDASRLVALDNNQVLAWNLLDGSLLFQTSREAVTRVFYSSDKTEVYGLDASGLVTVFDANTGAVKTAFLGQPTFDGAVAYSPESGWLALGGSDGTVKVWDTYNRQSLVTINTAAAAVTALAFSADGEALATAGTDGVLRLWHWRDRTLTKDTTLDQPITIRQLAYAPNGSYLAIGTDQDARLWSQDGGQVYVLDTGRGDSIQMLQFSPDSLSLLAGNQSAGLSLWNIAKGALAARLPDTSGENVAAAFSPDSGLLVTAILNGKVAIWNLAQLTGDTLNQSVLDVGTKQILDVAWTSDSRLVMFFDASGPVYLWGVGK